MESRTQGHFRYRKSCIERVRDSVYVYLLALILERPYDKTFPFELWISVDRPSLPQGRMREGFFAKQLVLLLGRSPGGAAYITAALEYAGPESFEIRLECGQLTWAPHWCVACIRSHALPTLAVDCCEDCDVGPDVGSSAHPTENSFCQVHNLDGICLLQLAFPQVALTYLCSNHRNTVSILLYFVNTFRRASIQHSRDYRQPPQ